MITKEVPRANSRRTIWRDVPVSDPVVGNLVDDVVVGCGVVVVVPPAMTIVPGTVVGISQTAVATTVPCTATLELGVVVDSRGIVTQVSGTVVVAGMVVVAGSVVVVAS